MKRRGGWKILSFAFAVVMAAFMLTGCGMTVDLAVYSDGQYYYNELTLSMKNETKVELESNAASNGFGKWKISSYVESLANLLSFSDGSKYEFTADGSSGNMYFIKLTRTIDLSKIEDDDDGEPDENYRLERKNYFYVYETHVTMSNPFNGLRAQWDESQAGDGNLPAILRHGLYSKRPDGSLMQVFPSISEAFPSIKTNDIGLIVLAYLRPAAKMGASSGEEVDIEGTAFYRFDRLFDNSTETISYMYYSPNPVGWYITAIAVGCIVTGLILLATAKRRRKMKTTRSDLFPYDPSVQDGGGDNLPGGYNGGGFKY